MIETEDDRDSTISVSDEELASDDEDIAYEEDKWARKFFDDSQTALSAHVASSFDAYFNQANRSSRTSSNIFSQLVAPLNPDEFQDRLRDFKSRPSKLDDGVAALERAHADYFHAYLSELASGFNLIFYGYGSKRTLLNKFSRLCAKKGHVVVGNGFFPSFTLKDLLSSAEQLIDAPDVPDAGQGPEGQVRRILAKYALKPNARHLFFIIHNIDGASLRTERARACFKSLASHPSIHLTASVDHIMSPILFSTTDTFSRSNSFSWLWHDLTTLRAYDFETAYADRTSFAGASLAFQQRAAKGQGGIPGASGAMISESAAKHVLASVTAKAKRLFALLCTRQRAAIDAAETESGGSVVKSSPQVATSYELLFAAARDDFIATNETAMRALLSEFRDHNLVLSATAAEGGEALWVPLSKDTLNNLATGFV